MLPIKVTFNVYDNFWSSDKTALNILLGKLEKANKSTLVIQEFFKQRAQLEEEYGNQLLRLSQSLLLPDNDTSAIEKNQPEDHETEIANFILSSTTEMCAHSHLDLGRNMKNMIELPFEQYLKEQESIKEYMITQMKESQSKKILYANNVKKARQTYIYECQSHSLNDKDIEILDLEYQKAVNIMQSESHSWIHDWRENCKTFQSLELNRLEYLKVTLKTFSSMLSSTFGIDDYTSERIQVAMDDLDPSQEFGDFVRKNATGAIIPDVPKYTKYESLYSGNNTTAVDNSSNHHSYSNSVITTTVVGTSSSHYKQINIPVKPTEELRSVNDQLKKIPTPWEKANGSSTLTLDYPHKPPTNNSATLVYNTHQNTIMPKKTSLLLPAFHFFNKKKKVINSNTVTTGVTAKNETPPSPIFSQMDFYYSPSNNICHV